MAGNVTVPENLTTLYDQLKTLMLGDTKTLEYVPQTRDQLRANLQSALMPTLQQSIQHRQQATRRNNAAVDADAAARGIGASTWGTDVKNRNANAEAQDIASMRGSYNATLANNLNSLLSDQENRKLAVDQANQSSRANAISSALQVALGNYQKWGAPEGSGGYYQPLAAEPEETETHTETDPYAYTRSYDSTAKASQGSIAQSVIDAYRRKKYRTTADILRN